MTELQNDRMTDRTKTICPSIFDLGGIKIPLLLIMYTYMYILYIIKTMVNDQFIVNY